MAKIKQSPKLPPEERRLQLLSSAADLFAKKGYRLTTTEQIARKAGVTKGALYFHFNSKEDMFYELVKHVVSHYKNLLTNNKEHLSSPGDIVAQVLHPTDKSCHGDPLSSNLDFWVQAISVPRIKRFMNRHFKEIVAIIVEIITPHYGSSKKEREEIAIMLLSYLDGMMVRQVMDPKSFDIHEQIKLFYKYFDNNTKKRKKK